MSRLLDTGVLIVGAGPVGLTLAIDLAWRGVDVTIIERRRAGEPPNVRCNQVSARSMEIFRRLGLADRIRKAGLPPDYPNDVVCCVSATGAELSRVHIPSPAERRAGHAGADDWWPTAEPPHRINQIYLEPVLFGHAKSQPRIRIVSRAEFDSFVETDDGVRAVVRMLDGGEQLSILCHYLVGCDGGKSAVRRMIGAKLAGTPVLQRAQSTHIRAPQLLERLPGRRGWMYIALNPRRSGTMIAIDGRENWLIHNFLHPDEPADALDRDRAIRAILGVDANFAYSTISKQDWVGRRLVADRFRDGRVFICGDSAHLWIPHAGYGMNAGIADAANLAWLLAGVLKGWAAPAVLDAYQAERQPITEQVSRFAAGVASENTRQRRTVPVEIDDPGPIGDAVRARIGREASELYARQQCAAGLNFGYYYDGSPIIAYDGEAHPPYSMHEFTSSAVPGCRLPHLRLHHGTSLYDQLGPDYTLIRLDPAVQIDPMVEAARLRGLPLAVLDIVRPEAPSLYGRKLLLVRPDQHVAWRADEAPPDPFNLIDLVRGVRTRLTPRSPGPPCDIPRSAYRPRSESRATPPRF
jgi:2-polyprenyl-6-methoxyphenol hydroxylase-like FAD-dependent oxidoreductase